MIPPPSACIRSVAWPELPPCSHRAAQSSILAGELADWDHHVVRANPEKAPGAHNNRRNDSLGQDQIINLSDNLAIIIIYFLTKHMPLDAEPADAATCALLRSPPPRCSHMCCGHAHTPQREARHRRSPQMQ